MDCARVNKWKAPFQAAVGTMAVQLRHDWHNPPTGISGPCNSLYSPPSLPILMSSMATSSLSFQPILDAALVNYRNQTKVDLTKHPSAEKLQNCFSLDDILQLLLERETAFNVYRDKHRELIDSLRPIVQALHAFSPICGEAAGLVSDQHDIFFLFAYPYASLQAPFQPTNAIFVGIDVLLSVRVTLLPMGLLCAIYPLSTSGSYRDR